MKTRLFELLDRDAIWQVMQRYARGLDRLDNALALSCYWPDAIEDHSHFVGSPADFVRYADGTTLAFASCQHGIANHFCDLQGDDAYCETYYIFTARAIEPPHFMSTGRYIDHFQKRDGEWRIANRVTIVEGTFDLSPSKKTEGAPSAYQNGEVCQATRGPDDVSYHRPPVPRRR